jgi:hypothetical protein
MLERKNAARRAVTDALNGDIDKIDGAVRRALVALATEHDEQAGEVRIALNGMEASVQAGVDQATQRFNESMDRIDRRVTVMTRLLVSTACTLLTTTVAAMFASIL